MTGTEFVRFCKRVWARMSRERRRHVLGVARAAERLAARNAASPLAARIAGVIHDVAREWKPAALLEYCASHDLAVSALERAEPVLLHARIAARLARDEYGIDDPAIVSAVERHTVARPDMTTLEKCVYVADSIEPSRTRADRQELAALAQRDLDAAFFETVRASICYLLARRAVVAPETMEVYNQLVGRQRM